MRDDPHEPSYFHLVRLLARSLVYVPIVSKTAAQEISEWSEPRPHRAVTEYLAASVLERSEKVGLRATYVLVEGDLHESLKPALKKGAHAASEAAANACTESIPADAEFPRSLTFQKELR